MDTLRAPDATVRYYNPKFETEFEEKTKNKLSFTMVILTGHTQKSVARPNI